MISTRTHSMKLNELREISDEIVKKYQEGMSTYDIGRELSAHPQLVNVILKSKNIKMRSRAELNHKRYAKDMPISENLYEMIDGWLLGDGNLSFTGVQAYFSFVSKYEEYANYVAKQFANEGIICRQYHGIDKVYKTDHYRLMTPSTLQIGHLYHKWYKNGKKIVPINFKLTCNSIKNWIMDDGTVDKNKGHLRLCTCSFTIDECENLSSKLNEFLGDSDGSWVIEKNKNPRIYVPRVKMQKLINKIGNCDVRCFEYKWQKGGA